MNSWGISSSTITLLRFCTVCRLTHYISNFSFIQILIEMCISKLRTTVILGFKWDRKTFSKGNISGNQWNLWNPWLIKYLIDFWRHIYIWYLQKSMGHFYSQDIISPKINETELSDISQISKNQWDSHWFLEI